MLGAAWRRQPAMARRRDRRQRRPDRRRRPADARVPSAHGRAAVLERSASRSSRGERGARRAPRSRAGCAGSRPSEAPRGAPTGSATTSSTTRTPRRSPSTCRRTTTTSAKALACHRSQFTPSDAGSVATRLTAPQFQQLIESRDAQLGARTGVAYAEGRHRARADAAAARVQGLARTGLRRTADERRDRLLRLGRRQRHRRDRAREVAGRARPRRPRAQHRHAVPAWRATSRG